MKIFMLSILLVTSNIFAGYSQDFNFTLQNLESVPGMSIDQFNRFMNESKWSLTDVGNESEDVLPFMEFMLPSNSSIGAYKAKMTLQYSDRIPSNRLGITLYNVSDYNKIKDEVVKSNYRLLNNFKQETDDYDDVGQLYQNNKYSYILITRDNGKANIDENGKYSPFYTYVIWLYSNEDFNQNVTLN